MSFIALEAATQSYIADRRKRVDAFVAEHFSWKATLLRLRETFLRDALKHLFNFVFAIPALAARKLGSWLEKLGWDALAKRLLDLPLSLKPTAEKRIEALVAKELLGVASPQEQTHAYAQAIYADEKLRALWPLHPALRRLASAEHFFDRLSWPMKELVNARWTIFQALSSALLLLAARMVFGEVAFDVYAIGNKVAQSHAKDDKSSSFFLGKRAGSVFYDIFPPDPSPSEVFVSIALLIVGLGVFSVVLSAVLEPLQRVGGVQRRQLHKLLDQLEDGLMSGIRKDALSLGLVGLAVAPEMPMPDPSTGPVFGETTTPITAPTDVPQKERWLSRATDDMTLRMRHLEARFGRRRIVITVSVALVLFGWLAFVISDRLRDDPYREVRSLIADRAFTTALSRLDDLGKVKGYQQHSDYWFWRGHALIGTGAWDASAEAHRAAIKRNALHRENDVLIDDLIEAVAHGSPKAKSVLVAEIGPPAIARLVDRSTEKAKIDRWAIVDAVEKLGGRDELDYEDVAEIDLEVATSCAEKKKTVQAVAERKIVDAAPMLKELEGQADLKCLQEALKNALAAIGTK